MSDLNILDQPVLSPSYEIWGQVSVAVWKAALVKGQGKIPFDPAVHNNMVYAIDLSVVPLNIQDAKLAERSLIQTSKEWKLTQESIQATGVQPSEIDGKYVRIKFEPTGETYTNSNGETKNKTYMHFTKVFKGAAECEQDYRESNFSVTAAEPAVGAAQPADNSGEYDTALKFLGAAVRTAAKGKTSIPEIKSLVDVKIGASPVMKKFFTADSDEVTELISQALGG